MNNLLIGPDAHARFLLQSLKAHEGRGKLLAANTPIIEGIRLSNDSAGKVKGHYESIGGEMLSLSMQHSSSVAPKWQALHISLGEMNLNGSLLLGILIKSRSPSSLTTKICLRSGKDGDFQDVFFSKTMVSFGQVSAHLDVLEFDKNPTLPHQVQWRDLILFFRPGEVNINLLDIRLFVV
ncbi:hypothetical protein [Thioclava sp.]|uniref:hypothetical protein n=1 Tax=Thioclava sp. TaxID=1933450 RepID=UPI003AA8E324